MDEPLIDFAKERHKTAHSATPDQMVSRWRAHAIALAFGTFAVGTDAFVIAGVLPSVATSLHVMPAAAGQLMTVFSLAYALASPILSALTAVGPAARRSLRPWPPSRSATRSLQSSQVFPSC
jgi:DHA1 family inner membrane transport protein